MPTLEKARLVEDIYEWFDPWERPYGSLEDIICDIFDNHGQSSIDYFEDFLESNCITEDEDDDIADLLFRLRRLRDEQ